MKQWVAVGVGLMTLALGGADSASAQITFFGPGYYGGYYGPHVYQPRHVRPGVSPAQAVRIVQSAGFTPLEAPERRGSNYVMAAVDRGGGQVWVVVNAHEGEILNVQPARRLHGGLVPYDPRLPIVPPVANRQHADTPFTGSVTGGQSAGPPIPRARPRVASNDAVPPAAPAAAAPSAAIPEGPSPPLQSKPATPMVPVAPLE